MATKLSESEISTRLGARPGWSAEGDRSISQTFKFKDHITALGFVVRVGMVAEVLNHHPDLRIVYNRVEIALSTHDADGVTEKDFEFAEKIDGLG
jgi:4a-hydroxytetrahydrobiopterin dehydratase